MWVSITNVSTDKYFLHANTNWIRFVWINGFCQSWSYVSQSLALPLSLSTWIGKELEEFSKIQNVIQFAFIKTASDIISWIKFFCWLGGHQQVLGQNAFMRYADPHGKPKKKKETKKRSTLFKFSKIWFSIFLFHLFP